MHEPLDERPVRLDREPMPLGRLLDVVIAHERAELADRLLVDARRAGGGSGSGGAREVRARLRRDLPRDAQLAHLGEHARGLRCAGTRRCGRPLELREQPTLRVGADRAGLAGPGAEPEAVGGDGRVFFNIDDPRLEDPYPLATAEGANLVYTGLTAI